jgi:hypothetical protein
MCRRHTCRAQDVPAGRCLDADADIAPRVGVNRAGAYPSREQFDGAPPSSARRATDDSISGTN